MIIHLRGKFKRKLKKLGKSDQERLRAVLKLFARSPFNSELRNHKLKGRWRKCRSIDIRSNLRAVYREENDDEVSFIDLGSHDELYK